MKGFNDRCSADIVGTSPDGAYFDITLLKADPFDNGTYYIESIQSNYYWKCFTVYILGKIFFM